MPKQRSLFDPLAEGCIATREAVAAYGCPLCGGGPDEHEPETVERDVPSDVPLGAWMLSLPRVPA